MRLGELLKGCDHINLELGTLNLELNISGVAYDSRKVKEGYLFVAMKGERHDGHDFINEAIEKGAVAIVHDSKINNSSLILQPSSLLKVRDSRKALACIANNFYGIPSKSLTVVGITGTNGKTTTTYILKSILESWGKEVGLIGTIKYTIKDRTYPALHTTPESLEFHGLLKEMLSAGCTHVISEVSSHALAQHRVDGTIFSSAVFANLTRDHLDFHKTMEDYFKAKERLFVELLAPDGICIINLDDPYGRRLNSKLKTQNSKLKNILTYGLEAGADIIASDIVNSFEGLRFKISFRGMSYDVSSCLMGLPNVYNIMSAVGASISLRVPWQIILEGIEKAHSVTGRFEKVDLGQSFLCIVDYAHTEDALERLISTARELITKFSPPTHLSPLPAPLRGARPGMGEGKGGDELKRLPRVITVFGCGGDRDRGKRPRMGEVATRLSDLVIITSDNPRSEEPLEIIKEIECGAVRKNYLIEPDREKAIKMAVDMVDVGDMLLIAGKGHEDYQEIKGVRYRFNDRDVLEEAIKSKLKM
jgi:UDP-N-acetylmuramoyl-L-alanyl-D-glutamate--2,6-diaminopimelate ligase